MSISYDAFTEAFLSKITERDLLSLQEDVRTEIVDGYMKRAVSQFRHVCKYDLAGSADDALRVFHAEIKREDIDEIVDIVSEGMVVQWLTPLLRKQELYRNILSTKDFSAYSPAELLRRVNEAYKDAKDAFVQMMREYSYNVGDLTELHL